MRGTALHVDIVINPSEWAHDDVAYNNDVMPIEKVGCLPNATSGGNPAFMVALTLPDGSKVLGQTTWAAARAAFMGLEARYGLVD